jgi:hypothetical protein
MNTYRVVLKSLGTVLVEADSATETGDAVTFYRDGCLCAEYAIGIVKSYELAHDTAPVPFLIPEREDSQSP